MPRVRCSGGSAAAQCGEAPPHRRRLREEKEAAPPRVEAQPRRWKSKWTLSVSHRLTALWKGRAAKAIFYFTRNIAVLFSRPCGTRNKFPLLIPAMNRWAIFTASLRDAFFFCPLLSAHCPLFSGSLLTAHCSLSSCWLAAFCLLPTAFSQNETPSPQAQPSPSPAPSPSPSPTPPPNLHQWGAVTSFHGLPSDRTHAIAQTEFGVTWFATDGGLARYDGRRTNAINAEGLPPAASWR